MRIFKFFLLLAGIFVSINSFASGAKVSQGPNFLILSDIHFDPFASCVNSKPCAMAQILKNASIDKWAAVLLKENPPPSSYHQDTNYALLQSTLKIAKQAALENNVQWVMILGDFLGHNFRENYNHYLPNNDYSNYQQFVKKTMQFLHQQIVAAFPSLDIYPLIGNNDTYNRDYCIQPYGKFLEDMQAIWIEPIHENVSQKSKIQKTFAAGGYYAIEISDQSLRLIMLDSVLFSGYFNDGKVDFFASNQILWLQSQLQEAKIKNQKVIIAMHIPPGIDIYATLRMKLFTLMQLWQVKYYTAYEKLLAEFAGEVIAIFAGHLHIDWFHILTFKSSAKEILAIGVPSISPLFGNNPGFKIYKYSQETQQLQGFVTYYYPLNQRGPWKIKQDYHSAESIS